MAPVRPFTWSTTGSPPLASFPIAENEHRDGILARSLVPARVAQEVAWHASQAAQRVAESMDYVGVLCVEFFLLADGSLLVNEMAPRPHNSGHWSIDACVSSQFEQQVRVLAGLPLGSVRQFESVVMLNLMGDLWFERPGAQAREPDWPGLLAHPDAKLHLMNLGLIIDDQDLPRRSFFRRFLRKLKAVVYLPDRVPT